MSLFQNVSPTTCRADVNCSRNLAGFVSHHVDQNVRWPCPGQHRQNQNHSRRGLLDSLQQSHPRPIQPDRRRTENYHPPPLTRRGRCPLPRCLRTNLNSSALTYNEAHLLTAGVVWGQAGRPRSCAQGKCGCYNRRLESRQSERPAREPEGDGCSKCCHGYLHR